MKATIEYNLNDADDKHDYYLHNKADDMAMFIWELVSNTKKGLEYDIEAKRSEGEISNYDTLDMVFEKIGEMLNEYDINVDRLG